jgi:hypothetical protein
MPETGLPLARKTERDSEKNEASVAVTTQKVEIEITIDRNFDDYTQRDQERLLRAIGERVFGG